MCPLYVAGLIGPGERALAADGGATGLAQPRRPASLRGRRAGRTRGSSWTARAAREGRPLRPRRPAVRLGARQERHLRCTSSMPSGVIVPPPPEPRCRLCVAVARRRGRDLGSADEERSIGPRREAQNTDSEFTCGGAQGSIRRSLAEHGVARRRNAMRPCGNATGLPAWHRTSRRVRGRPRPLGLRPMGLVALTPGDHSPAPEAPHCPRQEGSTHHGRLSSRDVQHQAL